MIHIQNPVYYCKFRHIQAGLFRIKDIFRTLSRHILAYILAFQNAAQRCHIEICAIFTTLSYSEFWHI